MGLYNVHMNTSCVIKKKTEKELARKDQVNRKTSPTFHMLSVLA